VKQKAWDGSTPSYFLQALAAYRFLLTIVSNNDTIVYRGAAMGRQRKTFDAIFENPIRANIAWGDIESMFLALGAEVSEGRGSRVRVALRGVRAVFHRPHPEKEASKGCIKSVRRFLLEANISIDDLE
jgi:hypothetical protein